jgi:hypothetical protein
MIRFLSVWILALTCSVGLAGGLDGDAKALARVELMLDAIGGRENWSSARSLYTMERARHPAYGDSIIATFWRDLEAPGEFMKLSHEKINACSAWYDESGWFMRDGKLRDLSEAELKERNFYWHREIYTLYHQLAKAERKLTVRELEPNGFTVLDEAGDKIGDFQLTPSGDLYLWRQFGGDDPVAYVYGPHKDFGEISFPDWGTATDGGWSFYYVQVHPSSKPFKVHADLTRPREQWSGGALKKDPCED